MKLIMANRELTNIKNKNKQLEKQRKYAWGKYYEAVEGRHIEQVSNYLMTKSLLEKVEDIPDFVVKELNDLHKELKKSVECPICYDVLENFKLSNCGHKYCKTCYDKLIDTTNKCALCRKQLKWIKNN
jgi:hypothetical protein